MRVGRCHGPDYDSSQEKERASESLKVEIGEDAQQNNDNKQQLSRETPSRRSRKLLVQQGNREIKIGETTLMASKRKASQLPESSGVFSTLNLMFNSLLLHLASLCKIDMRIIMVDKKKKRTLSYFKIKGERRGKITIYKKRVRVKTKQLTNMNCIFWNIKGLGSGVKRKVVRNVCAAHHLDTKVNQPNHMILSQIG